MHSARLRRAAAVTGALTAALLAWLPALSGPAAAQSGNGEPRPGHRDEPAPGRIQETDAGIKVNGLSVPVHGCLGEGYRKLYEPKWTSTDPTFPFQLSAEAHTRAEADSRTQWVNGNWSRCMARSGYPGIGDPYQVTEKLRLGDDLGGSEAIAAAVRDVACKQKVNLVGFGAAIETAYQKRISTEVADALAAYRTQRATRLALAANLP
ncbi:hypothetical protein [Streptomyces sp. NBC_00572]|uniref:hypothetical protein n=1 Tax=Streptomyces sp. NBC_00572 TaxID=2903664 RepID=UPI00225ABC4A|nr:hypothetical protein [Streptomyces sp. NBC_00572]MCX4986078.1 hypothetical protein [Streptomyces sp. NBC_00572]